MNRSRLAITLAALLLVAACNSRPANVQPLTLLCKYIGPNDDRGDACFGFYSFTEGALSPPPEPAKVDLLYYFDRDDCAQGALIGHDDRPGYLFPIGHKPWRELKDAKPPAPGAASVDAIAPLTKDKQGLAFWVKSADSAYTLARIRAVHPATHADLLAGATARLELEWIRKEAQ